MTRRVRRARKPLGRLLGIANAKDDGLGSRVRLLEAAWDPEGGLDLGFECRRPNQDDWLPLRVRCRHVCDHRLSFGRCSPRLEKDHPLLWPFVDDIVEVYFHGRPSDPKRTESALADAHRRLAQGWLDLDRHPEARLDSGYGLLGWAPRRLAKAYASVLKKEGVGSNFLPGARPRGDLLDEDADLPAPARNLRVLLLDERRRSYVVAGAFEETVPASRRKRPPRR